MKRPPDRPAAAATPAPVPADLSTYIRSIVATDIGGQSDIEITFDSRSFELEDPRLTITFSTADEDDEREDVNVTMTVTEAFRLPGALESALRTALAAGVLPAPEEWDVFVERHRLQRAAAK